MTPISQPDFLQKDKSATGDLSVKFSYRLLCHFIIIKNRCSYICTTLTKIVVYNVGHAYHAYHVLMKNSKMDQIYRKGKLFSYMHTKRIHAKKNFKIQTKKKSFMTKFTHVISCIVHKSIYMRYFSV